MPVEISFERIPVLIHEEVNNKPLLCLGNVPLLTNIRDYKK